MSGNDDEAADCSGVVFYPIWRGSVFISLGRASVLSRLALRKKMVGVIPTLVKVHHFSP
ncbi:hypothetical protein HMPREF9080_01623 [Cardiobacterium valvarum F0432]|uniref:Uncharacterized protein n=1 Tax=Cardiobacterium valvarum F0432 TaxID=797473 RepID=G9ZFR0_9GAMM|nr:hypothetical protein HMPREF9080_01623 [Cardiobacterium valvarum F0432]